MKPMKKRIVETALFDIRGMLITKGDIVLARLPFPKGASVFWGPVVALRIARDGQLEAKIAGIGKGKWYKKPIKLADK